MSGRDAPTGARFASAAATGQDWRTTVKACLDKLGPVDGCNLGFLYVSDALAADAVSIVGCEQFLACGRESRMSPRERNRNVP